MDTRTTYRIAVLALLVSVVAACEPSDSGCVIGPCDTTGGNGRIPVVAGFPSARAFSGVGRLAPGDTMTLHAIRIGTGDDPCIGADTVKTNVQWGVSNPTAATITPLPNGGVLVRASAQGTFQMLMREGGTGALSSDVDAKIVYTCPAGLTIANIGVAP